MASAEKALGSKFSKRSGRIRLGMVGGGNNAFIGGVHRIAARLDDRYELVAGALSSTPQKSQESGKVLGLSPDRVYDDFKKMAIREARLKDGIEAVSIVTPGLAVPFSTNWSNSASPSKR